MSAPKVKQTIQDRGLGASPAATSEVPCIMGCSSAGTANVPRLYAGGQHKKLVADYGYGPAVEAAALHLAKGQPVVFMKLPSTTAGSAGTDGEDGDVTFDGTGTSVITITGAAYDSFELVFEVLVGGTIGVAGVRFRYSLDGGRTWSPKLSLGTANTYLLPNTGLTLHFAAGTLVATDSATALSLEPKWAAADLGAAFAALLASSLAWSFIHLIGACSATEAAAVKTQIDTAEAAYRYTSVVTSARGQSPGETESAWMTAITTDFASFVSSRVVVAAGQMLITSPLSSRLYRRPIAWSAVVRACARPIHEDLGKVKVGPLDGQITDENGNPICHDERVTPGLDAERFMTITTFIGKKGVYICNPNVMAEPGSDFELWQYRRVMDKVCATTYGVLLTELSSDLFVNPKTGFILERDALAIESAARTALYDAVEKPGHVSPGTARLILARNDNILSNRTINTTTRAVPKGYVKEIDNDVGYTNPALNVQPQGA